MVQVLLRIGVGVAAFAAVIAAAAGVLLAIAFVPSVVWLWGGYVLAAIVGVALLWALGDAILSESGK